jgi:hypothetical protein
MMKKTSSFTKRIKSEIVLAQGIFEAKIKQFTTKNDRISKKDAASLLAMPR